MQEQYKRVEEMVGAVKAVLKAIAANPDHDPRALAVAKTHFESAMLWLANAETRAVEALFSD